MGLRRMLHVVLVMIVSALPCCQVEVREEGRSLQRIC
jgi:hypothetical protein